MSWFLWKSHLRRWKIVSLGETNLLVIPSKPDKIGFWFYELCVLLGEELVFMIHIKLQIIGKSDKLSKEKTVVFVGIWMNIMKAFGAYRSVLFYDSYGTNEARKMLRDNRILYVSACKESNFTNLTDQLWSKSIPVSRAGGMRLYITTNMESFCLSQAEQWEEVFAGQRYGAM